MSAKGTKAPVPLPRGKGKGKAADPTPRRPPSGPKVARSKRAGVVFPVSRLGRFLKEGRYSKWVGEHAPVYLASVMEYLCAEMLELAGDSAQKSNRHRIAPRHIQLAIREDEEMQHLLGDVLLASAGAVKHSVAPEPPRRKPSKASKKSKAKSKPSPESGGEEREEGEEEDENDESQEY